MASPQVVPDNISEVKKSKKFYPDTELSERICKLFVRYIDGRPLVQSDEAVRGFGEYSGSRVRPSASEVTYIKHPELPTEQYDGLLTLLSDEIFVRRRLSTGGMDAIRADDSGSYDRIPRWRTNKLRMAYKAIAIRFRFGWWE